MIYTIFYKVRKLDVRFIIYLYTIWIFSKKFIFAQLPHANRSTSKPGLRGDVEERGGTLHLAPAVAGAGEEALGHGHLGGADLRDPGHENSFKGKYSMDVSSDDVITAFSPCNHYLHELEMKC